jgi:hypothetical protein
MTIKHGTEGEAGKGKNQKSEPASESSHVMRASESGS